MLSFINKIISFLYPNYCQKCDTLLTESDPKVFCQTCWEEIPVIRGTVCRKCYKPVITPKGLCRDCRQVKRFSYDKIRILALYQGIFKEAIHLYKYQKRWSMAVDFFRLLSTHIDKSYIEEHDMIVPVPLSREKRLIRGFSQTLLICRFLSKYYQVSLEPKMLFKSRETPSQSTLPKKERLKNILGSIAFNRKNIPKIKGKKVLLFDDVYTTGATIRECSRVLKEHGARRVNVLALARSV
ncbi:MAG: ComF family protein [Spirochaetes bacterium]|nr:ComF family protein [Spirochaetota bacterium]